MIKAQLGLLCLSKMCTAMVYNSDACVSQERETESQEIVATSVQGLCFGSASEQERA